MEVEATVQEGLELIRLLNNTAKRPYVRSGKYTTTDVKKTKRYYNKRKHFSSDEIVFFLKNKDTMSMSSIAKALGRTSKSLISLNYRIAHGEFRGKEYTKAVEEATRPQGGYLGGVTQTF